MIQPHPTARIRALALGLGAACHATFAAAIVSMIAGLYSGLRSGYGPLHGAPAVLANAILMVQFPIVHSFLLSRGGLRFMARIAPPPWGATLTTTTFAAIASAQILAAFVLWSPTGWTLYEPHGIPLWIHTAAFAASWIFLMKSIADADMRIQTGYLGWSSVLSGAPARYRDFPTGGLFGRCRQPIYLGFALVLWTGPVWTADKVAIATAWSIYCMFGPLHKELRYLDRFGDRYREYRERVPYFLPRFDR